MFFKSFTGCRHEESRDSRSCRGFSLFELMIVVAITMTVMAYAVPKFLTAYYTVRLKAACADLSGLMQKGRIQAARENAIFQVLFTTGSPQTAFVDMNNDQQWDGNATVNGVQQSEPIIYFAPSITMASGAPSGTGAPPLTCWSAIRQVRHTTMRPSWAGPLEACLVPMCPEAAPLLRPDILLTTSRTSARLVLAGERWW